MPEVHALITGPITGRIPHGDGFLDVTPDVLEFGTVEEAQAAAESIGIEHAVRGTHPLQQECAALNDAAAFPNGAPADVVKRHRAEHKALNKKAGI